MRKGSDVEQMALLYTTWPDAGTAERAATTAVGARLTACANILPAGRSIYRWQGQIETADEVIVVFKTTRAQAEALSDLLIGLHPYETPAVVALDIRVSGSNPDYLRWIDGETSSTTKKI